MVSTSPVQLLYVAALLGLTSHWTYFMHGEFHRAGPNLVLAFLTLFLLLVLYLVQIDHYTLSKATATTSLAATAYLSALCTSVLIYRGFFHRLRRFNGPYWAKFSKLWHMSQLTRLDNFKHVAPWHRQHGSYIRTGPNDLTVVDPDAVAVILGPGSRCTKTQHYDSQLPQVSMHSTRDKAMHDKRRRVWDRGFSTKALRSYEHRVKGYADVLLAEIRGSQGKPMNMAKWFNYYSFDVMGDLTFGRPFDMLKTGKDHECIKLLQDGMKPIGFLGQIPWSFPLLKTIPGAAGGINRFIAWCASQAEERKSMKVDTPDLMSWILDSPPMGDHVANQNWLHGDSRLAIVAGRYVCLLDSRSCPAKT